MRSVAGGSKRSVTILSAFAKTGGLLLVNPLPSTATSAVA